MIPCDRKGRFVSAFRYFLLLWKCGLTGLPTPLKWPHTLHPDTLPLLLWGTLAVWCVCATLSPWCHQCSCPSPVYTTIPNSALAQHTLHMHPFCVCVLQSGLVNHGGWKCQRQHLWVDHVERGRLFNGDVAKWVHEKVTEPDEATPLAAWRKAASLKQNHEMTV